MTEITLEDLIPLLAERPGAFPVGFVARTRVRLNKRHRETKGPCPFGEVFKIAHVRGWLNCSYAAAVEKETGEPYVPGETWHDAALDVDQRLTPFSEHPDTGRLYLRVLRPVKLDESYEGGLTGEQLAPYLPPPAEERAVSFRTYGLEALVEITFGGETYRIVGLAAAMAEANRAVDEAMASA